MKPLEGIKILDFSQLHGAVFSTMLLADFGAEIIKIEKPGGGDCIRQTGPLKNGSGLYHSYLNRNKKSITVDLKTQEGQSLIKEMVKSADAVVENYRYGTMEAFGLGYDVLSAINPNLVYGTLTGYGRTGELREKVCFDNTASAFSGMTDMTGYSGGPPINMSAQLGNLYGGLYLAIGILLAIINVKKGESGQMVDVSVVDSLLTAMEDGVLDIEFEGHPQIRNGNMSLSIAPYDTFKTKDGYVSVGVLSDSQWERCCSAFGMEDFLNNPCLQTTVSRGKNYISSGIKDRMEAFTAARSKFEIEELLSAQNIPCGSVCTPAEAAKSQQLALREMLVKVSDPGAGEVIMPGIVGKLSKTPGTVDRGAPLLGQDNDLTLNYINTGKGGSKL